MGGGAVDFVGYPVGGQTFVPPGGSAGLRGTVDFVLYNVGAPAVAPSSGFRLIWVDGRLAMQVAGRFYTEIGP